VLIELRLLDGIDAVDGVDRVAGWSPRSDADTD